MPRMSATEAAFQVFRATYPPRILDPSRVAFPDELHQLTAEQGLQHWRDGPLVGDRTGGRGTKPTLINAEQMAECRLWAVRASDVVSAHEHCAFASDLTQKRIKHSNLTGGAPAHSAGEMLFISADTVVVNGRSGRYGVQSAEEMDAVALAFCHSGYAVWSMGWDADVGMPAPFVGKMPIPVVP